MLAQLDVQLKSLPNQPGVYQFYDEQDQLLYVGKALSIKKRVNSYFGNKISGGKTKVLVKKIRSVKCIVVETETDALLLENNLIKKHKPRYNVLLRDDKTYPWICVKNESFPRIFLTRRVTKDGSLYFGPYTSVKRASALLDLIKELYQLRSCNFKLIKENIDAQKFKICLDYHIGNCKGACEGLQTEEEYQKDIKSIQNIIKGNFKVSLSAFEILMKNYAENLEFEKAQKIKEKIELLSKYQSKSMVVSPTINNVDVFSIVSDENYGYVNFLKIVNGCIIQSHTIEIKKKLEESDQELLELAIVEIRQRFNSQSPEIFVPFKIRLDALIKVTIPKIGDKKRIVELSTRNAAHYRKEQFKQMKIVDPERHVNRIMSQMKKDLRLKNEPRHIECFDNSNIQGKYPVAACVVFKNGKPSKKEYRNFNIKTVVGPDDFASMEEVVYRRYKRLVDEQKPLPDLIVIDGGKGQLSSAVKSLEQLQLRHKIPIIGIAKRLEEIFFPDDSIPLYLDKKSESLKIIQHARNEAHRFGITHHRNQRSKNTLTNEFEQISGIGKQTALSLLKHFKSVKRTRDAPFKELSNLIGKSKATLVYNYFNTDST